MTNTKVADGLKLLSQDQIAIIEWNLTDEKVNKLSLSVIEKFQEILSEIKNNLSQYKAVVMISKKPNVFIAGADIAEIQKLKNAEEAQKICSIGHMLFNQIEDIPIPFIAAIHGACLGGGCEMALACDYRIAADDESTQIGLPETRLGLIPGFGGCWRLPRAIGLIEGLGMILGGRGIDGQKALRLGLIDQLVDPDLLERKALQFAKQKISEGSKKRIQICRPKTWSLKFLYSYFGRWIVFHQIRKTIIKKSEGEHYPALLKAIEVVRSTYGLPASQRQKVMKIESHGFAQVATTDVSRNLIRLFYIMEAKKKQTGLSKGISREDIPIIRHIGVLGAGTMGGGIAHLATDHGFKVRMKDITTEALSLGLQEAHRLWNKSLKRKFMTKSEYEQRQNLLTVTTNYDGFKMMNVVIEAVVEDMQVKKTVISELSQRCKSECIIATNTSSLSVSEMADAHHQPENVVGMHFFNPVHKMPLIEVIRGEESSDLAIATVFRLARYMGKMPIVVNDSPGFLVNRLLLPYLNEAVYLLEEGYPISWIDQAFLDFGMPMGPLRLIDEVGIDVAVKVAHILHQGFGERAKPAKLMQKLSKSSRLGIKNKKGFYLYDKKAKETGEDKSFYDEFKIIIDQNKVSEEAIENEIIARPLYAMINEAARALEENVVEKPEDVDFAMIMGIGFPPFRGGLLQYAQQVGIDHIVQRLDELEEKHGERFSPSDLADIF